LPVHLLVVCTANIARSPLAAAVLDAHAQVRGLADRVVVTSAGVRALEGHPAAAPSVAIARRWGLDLGDHRSQPVTDDLVERSDLVVTMSERQRDDLGGRVVRASERCFTLRELDRLLADVEVADLPIDPAERVAEATQRAHRRRPFSAPSGAEDVMDPYGRSDREYAAVAAELVDLLGAIAPVLLGPEPERDVPPGRLDPGSPDSQQPSSAT
jgi:protein-tyrosine phosphatase